MFASRIQILTRVGATASSAIPNASRTCWKVCCNMFPTDMKLMTTDFGPFPTHADGYSIYCMYLVDVVEVLNPRGPTHI
jgi:hypothetical protein